VLRLREIEKLVSVSQNTLVYRHLGKNVCGIQVKKTSEGGGKMLNTSSSYPSSYRYSSR
jgi:hypothetical protein